DGHGLRVDPAPLKSFWTGLSHVVRNAIDHGIETPEARRAAQKTPSGRLSLVARSTPGKLMIEIQDDGAGIAWDRVAEKAKQARLPHEHHTELVDALFADGLSTREAATETSGRGVGMAAVRAIVQELGGTIEVESSPGAGTTFRFTFSAERIAFGNEHEEPEPVRAAS
ncbi:MAG: ATP-binding protein, partial [Myxococcota bacterium]